MTKPLRSLQTPYHRIEMGLAILFLSGLMNGRVTAQTPVQKNNVEQVTPVVQPPDEKLKSVIELGEIEISLNPRAPSKSNQGIRWSPKGTQVQLTSKGEVLVGSIKIGAHEPIKLEFSIAPTNESMGLLRIDLNCDGEYGDQESSSITPNLSRNKFWYSHQAILNLPFSGTATRPYPISIWYVDDPDIENESAAVIRWSRRGWHEGTFKIQDSTGTLVISDSDADGIFTDKDAWGLGQTAEIAYQPRNSTNSLARHAWLDGIAFQVVDLDESGQTISISAFDPGVSEAEDRQAKDPYAKDRTYTRSEQHISFSKDLTATLEEAGKSEKWVLIDFVTTWCGPCRVMDDLVYSAKPFVDNENVNNTLFVKLDGDVEKDLKEKYEVTGFPTLILLNNDGTIVRRAVGYQSVEKLLKFLER